MFPIVKLIKKFFGRGSRLLIATVILNTNRHIEIRRINYVPNTRIAKEW